MTDEIKVLIPFDLESLGETCPESLMVAVVEAHLNADDAVIFDTIDNVLGDDEMEERIHDRRSQVLCDRVQENYGIIKGFVDHDDITSLLQTHCLMGATSLGQDTILHLEQYDDG